MPRFMDPKGVVNTYVCPTHNDPSLYRWSSYIDHCYIEL